MNDSVFLDSNVLAYANDTAEPRQQHAAGCSILYSEDLNPGQKYGNIAVVNPFAD